MRRTKDEILKVLVKGDWFDICEVIQDYVTELQIAYKCRPDSIWYWKKELEKLNIVCDIAVKNVNEYCYKIAFAKCRNKWNRRFLAALIKDKELDYDTKREIFNEIQSNGTYEELLQVLYC